VTPYAAVQAQAFLMPGYSESGGFDLAYAAHTATGTRSGQRAADPSLYGSA
jgi:hypothetical protein